MWAGSRASRLVLAVLLVSVPAVGAITDCCTPQADNDCCPELSMTHLADNLVLREEDKLRIVHDPARCCSVDGSEPPIGCRMAYEVPGCSFCRGVCQDGDESCVLCPDSSNESGGKGADSDTDGSSDGDDLWPEFEPDPTFGSMDYRDPEQYECSRCSWDSMTKLEQRLLTQRQRSMVCDSTCLKDSGDPHYGVTLCDYFQSGKECRACCHEGHMVDGCMPCEGNGSCDSCVAKIKDEICSDENICTPDCHAHLCCSVKWAEYSGCEQKTMNLEMGELMEKYVEQCGVPVFRCDGTPKCSDTARKCTAEVSNVASRRMQEATHERCRLLNLAGAGIFDMKYTPAGTFGNELIFRAVDDDKHFVLQSIAIDACVGLEKLAFINEENAEVIVGRSSSGSLAWDDGTDLNPHVLNTGVGCPRHVWFLRDTQDTAEKQGPVYVTVDESEHPQFIFSDWVRVDSEGNMARTDLSLSCVIEKQQQQRIQF